MDTIVFEKSSGECESVLRDQDEVFVCALRGGHGGKHRNGGVMWTTAGAERLARKQQEAQAQK